MGGGLLRIGGGGVVYLDSRDWLSTAGGGGGEVRETGEVSWDIFISDFML